MSESNQNIQPTIQTTSVTITSFTVEINKLILFTSANFRVLLRNVEGNVVNIVFVNMLGDDYARWSNNDEYVYQFIAEQLGFTLL